MNEVLYDEWKKKKERTSHTPNIYEGVRKDKQLLLQRSAKLEEMRDLNGDIRYSWYGSLTWLPDLQCLKKNIQTNKLAKRFSVCSTKYKLCEPLGTDPKYHNLIPLQKVLLVSRIEQIKTKQLIMEKWFYCYSKYSQKDQYTFAWISTKPKCFVATLKMAVIRCRWLFSLFVHKLMTNK